MFMFIYFTLAGGNFYYLFIKPPQHTNENFKTLPTNQKAAEVNA